MGKRAASKGTSSSPEPLPAMEAVGGKEPKGAPTPTGSGDGKVTTSAAAAAAAPKRRRTSKKKEAEAEGPERVVFHPGLRPTPPSEPCTRLLTFNVAGLRALLRKSPTALSDLVAAHGADVLCLQEHKLQCSHVDDVKSQLGLGQPTLLGSLAGSKGRGGPKAHGGGAVESEGGGGGGGGGKNALQGWWSYWACSKEKKGYSGVAVLSRDKPLRVREGIGQDGQHDGEGRVVSVEFPSFWLVNVYTPNSGDGLKRLDYRLQEWDVAFSDYVKSLEQDKPVIVTGDLNCAHQEIDIHSPSTNLKSAGFTPEERQSFGEKLLGRGLVDCFRRQYPEVVGYTYWNYRTKARDNNKGWRLDYFLVSEAFHPQVHECYHLPDVMGSDHCPVGLVLKPQTLES